MSEFKPCPFCGSTGSMRYDGIFWVWCPECSSEGTPSDSEHEAIAAWNRRAVQGADARDAALKQAREALRLARAAIEPLTHAQIKLHRIPHNTDARIESAIAAIDAAMQVSSVSSGVVPQQPGAAGVMAVDGGQSNG